MFPFDDVIMPRDPTNYTQQPVFLICNIVCEHGILNQADFTGYKDIAIRIITWGDRMST